MGVPGGSVVKDSPANAGDVGSIPGSGRSPGEGNGNPLQYSCLENSMDEGAWLGYSPWGRKESDTTEQLHFVFLSYVLTLLDPTGTLKKILVEFCALLMEPLCCP